MNSIGKEPNSLIDQNNVFFSKKKKNTNEEWKHKDRILITKNEIKKFIIFLLKSIRRNTGFNQIEENRSKVYKTSHRQVFHLNSKSQICHKLILQVISHQIKDNAHNHYGSIGIFKVGLVGNLGFGFLLLFVCFFLLLFLLCIWEQA